MRNYVHALLLPEIRTGLTPIESVQHDLHVTASALKSSIKAKQTIDDIFIGESLGERHPNLRQTILTDLIPRARSLPGVTRREPSRNLFLLTHALNRYTYSTIERFIKEAQKSGKRGWDAFRAATLGAAYLEILSKKDEVLSENRRKENTEMIRNMIRNNPDELISRIEEMHDIHKHVANIHNTGEQNIRFAIDHLAELEKQSSELKESIENNYAEWLHGISTLNHYCPSRSSAHRVLNYLKESVPIQQVPRYASQWAQEVAQMENWQSADPNTSQQVDRVIHYLYRVHRVAHQAGSSIRPQHFIAWVEKIAAKYRDPESRPYLKRATRILGEHLAYRDRNGQFVFENIPMHLEKIIELCKPGPGKKTDRASVQNQFSKTLSKAVTIQTPPTRRRPG